MTACGPDAALALRLAEKCLDVYQNPSLEIGSLACNVSVEDGIQYVVFQGSNDIWDWLGNAKVCLVERERLGRLFDGFADFAAQFWKPLAIVLDISKPVVLAGHSLGGTLALILGARLSIRGYHVKARYTFGCPSVGDVGWRAVNALLEIPTFCFRHGCDGVPRLPPRGRQIAQQVFLDSKGRRLAAQMSTAWWKPWQLWTRRRADHAMVKYVEALRGFEAACRAPASSSGA